MESLDPAISVQQIIQKKQVGQEKENEKEMEIDVEEEQAEIQVENFGVEDKEAMMVKPLQLEGNILTADGGNDDR